MFVTVYLQQQQSEHSNYAAQHEVCGVVWCGGVVWWCGVVCWRVCEDAQCVAAHWHCSAQRPTATVLSPPLAVARSRPQQTSCS